MSAITVTWSNPTEKIHTIAKKTFTADLVLEGSFGEIPQGTHESTMELFAYRDGSFGIEWDIPTLDTTEHIGIFMEEDSNVVEGYDGVMSLPKQAEAFLTENGFDCSQL